MMDIKKILAVTCALGVLAMPATVQADDFEKPSIDKAIEWAVDVAHDQSYGYSQSGRWGTQGYDCSSFVITAFWNGGFKLAYDNRNDGCTEDIRTAFTESGFKWIPAEDLELDTGSTDLLEPGDVLLIEGYHAELYIGDGLTVAAHEADPSPEHPNRSHEYGDQGDEICVYDYVWHPWTGVLRYQGKSNSSEKSTCTESEANYEVAVDSLLVRTRPESDGRVIELLEENEKIKVDDIDDGWGRTVVRGKEGYVNMSYLKKLQQKSSSSESSEVNMADIKESPGKPMLTVNIDTLFMRKKPSKESVVVHVLNGNDKVKLLSYTGDWGYVSYGDCEGWVNLDYCI